MMGTVNSEKSILNNVKMANAIKHLTQAQAEVIEMYFFQDMTLDAIAERLGISRAGVQDRLNGALKKLKKLIQ